MRGKSYANGSGGSHANGPDMRAGSPVPPWLRDWENLMARAVAATFWEFV